MDSKFRISHKSFIIPITLILLLVFHTSAYAIDVRRLGLRIEEVDGDPSGRPRTLKVDNNTLTDNTDGSFTHSIAGFGDLTYLKLDQTTPQTISASPILGWMTNTSVPYIGVGGYLAEENSEFNYNPATNTLYVDYLESSALTLTGWTTNSIPFMGATYFTEDTDFTYTPGTDTCHAPTFTTANLTLNTNVITSDTGLVSFNDDIVSTIGGFTDGTLTISGPGNLSTTGTIDAGSTSLLASTVPVLNVYRQVAGTTGYRGAMYLGAKSTTGTPAIGFGPGYIMSVSNSADFVNKVGAVYGLLEDTFQTATPNGGTGGLVFATFNNGASDALYRLFVKADGDIGIIEDTPNAQLHIQNDTATDIGLIVEGAASQSANLQEWHNNASTVLASVSSAGAFTVPNLTDSALTSGRVTYAGASGILSDSANMTFDGNKLSLATSGSSGGLAIGTSANLYETSAGILATTSQLYQSISGTAAGAHWSGINQVINYTIADNDAYNFYSMLFDARVKVAASKYASGIINGVNATTMRARASGGNDMGRVANLITYIAYPGHTNLDAYVNPLTDNVYSYYSLPYYRRGKVTNLFQLYLGTPSTISTPSNWAGATAYSAGNVVKPTVSNGYYYVCSTAGTSGGGEPAWPATSTAGATPATVNDNTVVWTELVIPSITNEYGIYQTSTTALNYFAGKAGIGTTPSSTYTLKTYRADTDTDGTSVRVEHDVNITDDVTKYNIGFDVDITDVSIASGKTNSGYVTGCRFGAYTNDATCQGTQNEQYGVWGRAGIYSCGAGHTVNNARAGTFEILNSDADGTMAHSMCLYLINNGATGTNSDPFGIYQLGSATCKNYFQSNIGIGTTAPDRQLEINTGAATGGLRLSYNDSNGSAAIYGEMLVDSDGDLYINSTSGQTWLGLGGDVDYVLGFYGNTTQGTITYDEDNAVFTFDQDIALAASKYIQSRRVHTVICTPKDATLPSSNPATLSQIDGTYVSSADLVFTDGATNSAYWTFKVPDSYDGGTFTAKICYYLTTTTTATINDGLLYHAAGDDDAWDGGMSGDAVTLRTYGSATHAAGDLYIREHTFSGNLPTAGDLLTIRYRRASSASDTVDEDVKILWVSFEFNGDI